MKFVLIILATALSLTAFAQRATYPVKNIRYISEWDYSSEVLRSEKFVVMVFSSEACLERISVERSCWLFEKKLDYFVPTFSSNVKVIGFNTSFENYRLTNDLGILKSPTVILMNKGRILKRYSTGSQDQLLKNVLNDISKIP